MQKKEKKLNKKDLFKHLLLGLVFAVWLTSIVFIIISGYFPNAAGGLESFFGIEDAGLRSQSSYFLLVTSVALVFYCLLEEIKRRYLD